MIQQVTATSDVKVAALMTVSGPTTGSNDSAEAYGERSLLDLLLESQNDLSAVERFAVWQDEADHTGHAKYSALIPATPPAVGQQYAFQVDLESCSGCKACVVACHELNGLDETETWRDVGALFGGTTSEPVIQHVTTACHHCLDPACFSACPVKAYEKDSTTGIVRHLDDQCIGCQYCIFACPYDVPKYNRAKGIVRKCDMCAGRLETGEAPACVASCPNQAIRIVLTSPEQVTESCESGVFLPGAPDPQLTLPTTEYVSRRALPRNLKPADYYSIRPEHAHWPLILMLVLTQAAVGTLTAHGVLARVGSMPGHLSTWLVSGALMLQVTALAASILHLGRPHLAYRAVLGVRTSWLSREIIAFGLFTPAVAGYALCSSAFSSGIVATVLEYCAFSTGWPGVLCSAMVYIATRREFWNLWYTSARFLLTAGLLGSAFSFLLGLAAACTNTGVTASDVFGATGITLCAAIISAASAKLIVELTVLRHLWSRQSTTLKRSALLLTGELAPVFKIRVICLLVGGISLPVAMIAVGFGPGESGALTGSMAVLAVVLLLAGELAERYLFFTAVVAPKMPRGF
jgi:formate dehydrogenase iron-sulfur subunit